jgi:hypothetical protein
VPFVSRGPGQPQQVTGAQVGRGLGGGLVQQGGGVLPDRLQHPVPGVVAVTSATTSDLSTRVCSRSNAGPSTSVAIPSTAG